MAERGGHRFGKPSAMGHESLLWQLDASLPAGSFAEAIGALPQGHPERCRRVFVTATFQ